MEKASNTVILKILFFIKNRMKIKIVNNKFIRINIIYLNIKKKLDLQKLYLIIKKINILINYRISGYQTKIKF